MSVFKVTLSDPTLSRGWMSEQPNEEGSLYPVNTSILEVEADDADSAKAYAERQNPGLTVTEVEESN